MKKITYNGESKILIALCNLVNELVDAVGSAGDGDMTKSVYDTDGNGIVDNAEKVNGHTVNANVPENAVFTDTTYTFSQSGSQLTLTDDDGNAQSVNVPSTDTNTTYTMSLDGSKLTLTDSDGKTQEVTIPTSSSGGGSSSGENLNAEVYKAVPISTTTPKDGNIVFNRTEGDGDNVIFNSDGTITLKAGIYIIFCEFLHWDGNAARFHLQINNTWLSSSWSQKYETMTLETAYQSNEESILKIDSATSVSLASGDWNHLTIMRLDGSSNSGSELKITSDTWTPTNEYINGEKLYKRYYEKTFTPSKSGYTLLETFSNLGMVSNNCYITIDSSIYDSVSTGNFSPLRANDENFYTLCFATDTGGLCMNLSKNFVRKTLYIRAILKTVESNLVTS